jgi:hypothetical protein
MDPTIEAPIYSDRITITDTTTVKARLFVNNFPASAILSSSYIKVPEVVIIPAEVTFIGRTKIEITNQLGTGDIKYTLDGAEPTADSATYAGPITIESTLTISARLFLNTFPITDIYTADYVRIYAFEDDGIPFSWREEFFGANFLTLSDAAVDADPDGDGTSNLEEYLYRTDPNDSSSVPSPKLSVRAIPLLEFTTVPGKSYRLLQRSGVNDPWVTIKTITATQNQWEEHADLDAPPNSFYRVEVIE